MPALNFQARFVPKIKSGEKWQTIRRPRARGKDPKPGQPLMLYTGMRTKQCQKIGDAICARVQPVAIYADRIELDPGDQLLRVLLQTPDELEWFAQADGFPNWEEFRGFFEGSDRRGLPWFGFVIYWRDLKLTTTG